jgi:protein SMG6
LTCDGPNSYVTILLTFLQTVLRKPEGLVALERAIPWTDLAAFLSQGPRASSSWAQIEKLSQSNILLEDWSIRGMAWHGCLFESGFWDRNDDQLIEMEMLDASRS